MIGGVGHRCVLVTLVLVVAVLAGCAAAAAPPAPSGTEPTTAPAVCGLWLATGGTPTDEQVRSAAGRYGVVVLNAWETDVARRLRTQDPGIVLLVYKDLSSTRGYAEVGLHGGLLPTGVDGATADPAWFATDTAGRRIEWAPYPQHWQMTVWDEAYQRAWTDRVVAETVRDGWDGVFADNDMSSLRFYSDAVVAGTTDRHGTDTLLRDGLDALVTRAGTALAERGKVLVPNLSEARLFPGRWTRHARFGGAMEENFAQYGEDGALTTWQGHQWAEMLAAPPQDLTLLVTATAGRPEARPGAAERAGFAGAALLGGPRSCWTPSTTRDYSLPEWSGYRSLALGEATGPAVRDGRTGVWTRGFAGGWVALNPTRDDAEVAVPGGLRTVDGAQVGDTVIIGSADATILVRR